MLAEVGLAATNPERLARIGVRMKAFVDQGQVAGAVTLVMHEGKVVHHDAAGYLKLENKTPLQRDAIFEIMSMTKPVTCAGIMILAEEGLLAVNDPVEKFIPEFRGQRVAVEDRRLKPDRAITIRDLMTHTSGLPEMPPEGMGGVQFYSRFDRSLADAVSIYSQMPLLFQPGAGWQYSNPGIATLGRIIEVISGKAFETFLAQRVFQPLGMKDSSLFAPEDRLTRVSQVYQRRDGKLVDSGFPVQRKGARYSMPEGGMYSTASDMAAFYRAMLEGGKPILSKASVETMTAIHTGNVQRGANAYGLGWSVVQNEAGTLHLHAKGAYGHGGAFGTYGWVDPRRSLVGVLMIQLVGNPAGDIRNTFVEMANASVE